MNFITFNFDISHWLRNSMPTFVSVVNMTWKWLKEFFKTIVYLLMISKAHTSVVLFFTLQYYVHNYIFRHLIRSSTIFFFPPWLYSIYTACTLPILLLYFSKLKAVIVDAYFAHQISVCIISWIYLDPSLQLILLS